MEIKGATLIAFILNAILINGVFASSERFPDFTTPDFKEAFLFHGMDSKTNESAGPQTVLIPEVLRQKFQKQSKIEFQKLCRTPHSEKFDIYNWGLIKDFANHPEKHFFIYKIQLPASFKNKELYFMRIKYEKFPKLIFIFYDPAKNICSSTPLELQSGELVNVIFEDLLGVGEDEIGLKTYLPDGSVDFTDTRYYSCEEDFSFKEIFAYENSMENFECQDYTEILDENRGIITLSIRKHCNSPAGHQYDDDENYSIDCDLKNFDPLKAEKSLLTYFDSFKKSSK